MKKTLLGVIAIGLGLIMVGSMIPNVSATDEYIVTDSPSSNFALGEGDKPNTGPVFGDGRTGALDYARLRDSGEACLWNAYYDQNINTCSFTNPSYNGWPVQELPPDNATIDWVNILAVGHGHDRYFYLAYALNATSWDVLGGTATWKGVTAFNIDTFDPTEYHVNITALETWTASMLKDPHTWTRIYSTDRAGLSLYVDYLGLEYGYHYPGGIPGGPAGNYTFNGTFPLSIPGAFGTIGFIGMTITPAYAIMQWRQGGDGRAARFIMSIAAMLVFFTLFLASLGA